MSLVLLSSVIAFWLYSAPRCFRLMSILLLLRAFLPIDFHVGPRVAGSLIVADIFVFDVFIVGDDSRFRSVVLDFVGFDVAVDRVEAVFAECLCLPMWWSVKHYFSLNCQLCLCFCLLRIAS